MAIRIASARQPNFFARLLAQPLTIIADHRRAYITINLVYYSLILVGMVYAAYDPALQKSIMEAAGTAFTQGPLAAVTDAYLNTQVLSATLLTFGVNLAIGSMATITLPSLIVPFSGLLMGAYRALLWGLIYSPTTPEMQTILLPHALTLILEGQAYILVMLGAYLQGRAFLLPKTVGATSHRKGYWQGLMLTFRLYILVILVLLGVAIYEVLEATWLLSVLR